MNMTFVEKLFYFQHLRLKARIFSFFPEQITLLRDKKKQILNIKLKFPAQEQTHLAYIWSIHKFS